MYVRTYVRTFDRTEHGLHTQTHIYAVPRDRYLITPCIQLTTNTGTNYPRFISGICSNRERARGNRTAWLRAKIGERADRHVMVRHGRRSTKPRKSFTSRKGTQRQDKQLFQTRPYYRAKKNNQARTNHIHTIHR